MERDLHRSAGVIPCRNHHCAKGTVVSRTVDHTPEPLRSDLDRLEAAERAERERRTDALARAFGLPRRADPV